MENAVELETSLPYREIPGMSKAVTCSRLNIKPAFLYLCFFEVILFLKISKEIFQNLPFD
jgi:hypothetical protein